MKIDTHVIRQLTAWMSAGGIDLLELTTPETSVSLQREVPVDPVSSRASASLPPGSTRHEPGSHTPLEGAPYYEVTAPSPGIYLDRHPLSAQPLLTSGAAIEVGQLVGFLQIGSLLLAVRSAQAGRIVSLPQTPGDTLGYGSVVMRLQTEGRS
jgi:acetyl-CoA carboxylase biotin carboxyl carrier protein